MLPRAQLLALASAPAYRRASDARSAGPPHAASGAALALASAPTYRRASDARSVGSLLLSQVRKKKEKKKPAFSSRNGDYTAEKQFQTAEAQSRKGIRRARARLGLWII